MSGDDGNDTIWLFGNSAWTGTAHGGNGNDTIVGSESGDWIFTGPEGFFASFLDWTPETKLQSGGFQDHVEGGNGNDHIMTMAYCKATVEAGNGNDSVDVCGEWDIVSAGAGDDVVNLAGGAGKLDLGVGNDIFAMTGPAIDNPNASQVTLGAGTDHVEFRTQLWRSIGVDQLLEDSPLVLDFNLNEDVIDLIEVTNTLDPALSLDAANIKTIDIPGGSALICDSPVDLEDFCFARFKGVSAWELQVHIDQNTSVV